MRILERSVGERAEFIPRRMGGMSDMVSGAGGCVLKCLEGPPNSQF